MRFALGKWTASSNRGPRRFRSRGGTYAGHGARRSNFRPPVGRRSVSGCGICAVSTTRPSAPAHSRRASATCSPMQATRGRAPSFRWRDRRRPFIPRPGPAPDGPAGHVPRRARRASPPQDRVHDGVPPLVRDDRSTLRELGGVLAFVTAAGCLLEGELQRVVMDNLCCALMLGRGGSPSGVRDCHVLAIRLACRRRLHPAGRGGAARGRDSAPDWVASPAEANHPRCAGHARRAGTPSPAGAPAVASLVILMAGRAPRGPYVESLRPGPPELAAIRRGERVHRDPGHAGRVLLLPPDAGGEGPRQRADKGAHVRHRRGEPAGGGGGSPPPRGVEQAARGPVRPMFRDEIPAPEMPQHPTQDARAEGRLLRQGLSPVESAPIAGRGGPSSHAAV